MKIAGVCIAASSTARGVLSGSRVVKKVGAARATALWESAIVGRDDYRRTIIGC